MGKKCDGETFSKKRIKFNKANCVVRNDKFVRYGYHSFPTGSVETKIVQTKPQLANPHVLLHSLQTTKPIPHISNPFPRCLFSPHILKTSSSVRLSLISRPSYPLSESSPLPNPTFFTAAHGPKKNKPSHIPPLFTSCRLSTGRRASRQVGRHTQLGTHILYSTPHTHTHTGSLAVVISPNAAWL